MNGKDIFLGLKYVGDDLIEKAENGYKCLNNNVLTAQEPIPLKYFITKNIKAN